MDYRYHLSRGRLNREYSWKRGRRWFRKAPPVSLRTGRTKRTDGRLEGFGPFSRFAKGFLGLTAAAGFLVAAVWGGSAVVRSITQSEVFDVREVRASGLDRPEEAELLERLRRASGTSLFDLDLVSLKGTLLTEPWIKEVNLRKEYPGTLSVRVVKRRPVAIVAGPPAAIVDETGAVIEQWAERTEIPSPWSALPLIRGIEPFSLQDHDPDALERFATALEILRLISPAAAGDSPGDLVVEVGRPEDVRVGRYGNRLRFGARPYEGAWRRFASVESEIARRHDAGREIDLRFPDRVIVR